MPDASTMSDSYAMLVLNKSFMAENPNTLLSLFFLFLARIFPIIALAPFFGAKVLPHPVKVVLGISLFVIFLPQLIEVTTTQIKFNPYLVLLMAKELFIGSIIGFVISLPFIIVQNAGIFIDHQRGGASLMVNDPTVQNQSSPLGTLFNFVMIYLFFRMDGPFIFINAISHSFEVVPPDQFFNGGVFAKGSGFWDMMMKLLNQIMVLSIQLATPGLLAILMTDVFLGIANRLAPQVQITFLGMPLKSLLGLGIVCVGWQLMAGAFVKQGNYWLHQVVDMINLFKLPAAAAAGG